MRYQASLFAFLGLDKTRYLVIIVLFVKNKKKC